MTNGPITKQVFQPYSLQHILPAKTSTCSCLKKLFLPSLWLHRRYRTTKFNHTFNKTKRFKVYLLRNFQTTALVNDQQARLAAYSQSRPAGPLSRFEVQASKAKAAVGAKAQRAIVALRYLVNGAITVKGDEVLYDLLFFSFFFEIRSYCFSLFFFSCSFFLSPVL